MLNAKLEKCDSLHKININASSYFDTAQTSDRHRRVRTIYPI